MTLAMSASLTWSKTLTPMSASRAVSHAEAKRIAKRFGVRLPRVGYEMSLGDGRWLASTGHSQFGWFESRAKTPFEIRCHCTGTNCVAECPVLAT